MLNIRKSSERGFFDHGWLKSHHTFSFADYYDPQHMGFGPLRVINEDFIAPGKGFGTHGHRDMEIISYVVRGALAHKDSMGTGSTIRPGEIQYMCAGTGVTHSEFNEDTEETTHLLQIWIVPDKKNHTPSYDQKKTDLHNKKNQLVVLASPQQNASAIQINQDATLYAALLDHGASLDFKISNGRRVWIQVVHGKVMINGVGLDAGDGVAIENEKLLNILAQVTDTEFLLFDLG